MSAGKYDYVPTAKVWAKLSRDERFAIAERYVADADANRHADAPRGVSTMAQQHAAELMRLAESTPKEPRCFYCDKTLAEHAEDDGCIGTPRITKWKPASTPNPEPRP